MIGEILWMVVVCSGMISVNMTTGERSCITDEWNRYEVFTSSTHAVEYIGRIPVDDYSDHQEIELYKIQLKGKETFMSRITRSLEKQK